MTSWDVKSSRDDFLLREHHCLTAPGGDGGDIGAFEQNPPSLKIALFTTEVALSWPGYYTVYVLEATTNVNPPGTWTSATGTLALVSGQFTVTNTATGRPRFYRLHSQPPTPVSVTSGLIAYNKFFDGTTTATIGSNNVSLGGVAPADIGNVNLSTNGYTANFAFKGPGSDIPVSVSGLTLTGTAAANYYLIQPTFSANIGFFTPVTIASGLIANNKAYDGTTTATISSNNVSLSGVAPADIENAKSLHPMDTLRNFSNAGPGIGHFQSPLSSLTLTGSAAPNYYVIQPTLSANITP